MSIQVKARSKYEDVRSGTTIVPDSRSGLKVSYHWVVALNCFSVLTPGHWDLLYLWTGSLGRLAVSAQL